MDLGGNPNFKETVTQEASALVSSYALPANSYSSLMVAIDASFTTLCALFLEVKHKFQVDIVVLVGI
jgi:hypothetical protein